jgi:hypothetical protein
MKSRNSLSDSEQRKMNPTWKAEGKRYKSRRDGENQFFSSRQRQDYEVMNSLAGSYRKWEKNK